MGCGPALYSLALYSQVKAQGRSKQSLLRHEDLVCSPSHGLWACIVITSFVQPGKEETRRGQAIAGKECEWLAWVCVPMLLAVPMAGPQLPELKSSNVLLPSKSQQPLSHYWTKKGVARCNVWPGVEKWKVRGPTQEPFLNCFTILRPEISMNHFKVRRNSGANQAQIAGLDKGRNCPN
eukprot:scaffold36058_cov15-Tisochrysis_lutea.AAC.2